MQVEALKTWIRKRGYPDYLIKEHVEKTLRLTPSDENNSKKAYSISLVVTYGVENCAPPPVRVRVWFRVSVRIRVGGQFS